jgi:hypothetical protein
MTTTAPLAHEPMIFEQTVSAQRRGEAVHLPHTTEVNPFVQQGIEHLGRSKVAEAF